VSGIGGRGHRWGADEPPQAPPEGELSTGELLAELPADLGRLGDEHGVIRLGPRTCPECGEAFHGTTLDQYRPRGQRCGAC